MSHRSEPEVVIATSSLSSETSNEAGQVTSANDGIGSLVLPSPEDQQVIVGALEADGVEESLHVYTVSRDWYNRWRSFVGLPLVSGPEVDCGSAVSDARHNNACKATCSDAASGGNCDIFRAKSCNNPTNVARRAKDLGGGLVATPAECDRVMVTHSVTVSKPEPPGPVEMDLSSDDDNMSVDEKIWIKWIEWFGVADSHELDRRRWTVDERDFEICVLSPYCGLVENAVKSFDLTEQTGYVELQLRRVFRVARHRQTRLWVCEKSRHARFQPLLHRAQELCFQESIDSNKNYILAIEIGNPDGSWPSHVPGDPVGEFDRYAALYGHRRQFNPASALSGSNSNRLHRSSYDDHTVTVGGTPRWETELTDALNTVFGGIAAELKETTAGIVTTAKCMMSGREAELRCAVEALQTSRHQLDDRTAALEHTAVELARQETSLVAFREQLKADRATFDGERQKFAEELVRMLTVNKIQDSRVKLNVGGHVFVTSTLTLTKEPDTMLAAMFSGRHSLRQDDDGSYFIDRDGTHFRYILNFLRDGCCFRPGTLPTDRAFLSELLTEAEYYQVSPLVCLLNEHIRATAFDDDDDDDDGNGTRYSGEIATTRLPKTVGVFPSVTATTVTRIGSSPGSTNRRQKLLRKISSPPQQQQAH